MLVTRPDTDASETAGRLAAMGIETRVAPLMSLEVLPTGLPDPRGFAAIAVTSANALRALEARGALARYTALPLYAVGDKTARTARALGFAQVESAGGGFSDLVDLLAHRALPGPVFYPAAEEQAGDLGKSLAPFSRLVITTTLYRMAPASRLPAAVEVALQQGEVLAVLLYSRRTAEIFARLAAPLIPARGRAGLSMLCLSEAVASPLVDAHFVRIALAEHPSEEAMMALALSVWRDHNRPGTKNEEVPHG